MIWLHVRGKPFLTMCSTTLPAYEEHDNTGLTNEANLIAMVDKLGLPTMFFTHSVADLQWPELATPHLP